MQRSYKQAQVKTLTERICFDRTVRNTARAAFSTLDYRCQNARAYLFTTEKLETIKHTIHRSTDDDFEMVGGSLSEEDVEGEVNDDWRSGPGYTR